MMWVSVGQLLPFPSGPSHERNGAESLTLNHYYCQRSIQEPFGTSDARSLFPEGERAWKLMFDDASRRRCSLAASVGQLSGIAWGYITISLDIPAHVWTLGPRGIRKRHRPSASNIHSHHCYFAMLHRLDERGSHRSPCMICGAW